MSLINVILLSTTPVAGLGALLAMCRFEKWALEDRHSVVAAAGAPLAASDLDLPCDPALQAQPLHQAA